MKSIIDIDSLSFSFSSSDRLLFALNGFVPMVMRVHCLNLGTLIWVIMGMLIADFFFPALNVIWQMNRAISCVIV